MKQEERDKVFNCLGIPIDYLSKDSNREKIVYRLSSSAPKRVSLPKVALIATVNPEFLVYAHHNDRFKKVLLGAWLRARDGAGIRLAGLLSKKPLPERITGVELVGVLSELASKQGYRVGLIGGSGTSATDCFKFLQAQHPKLKGWADQGPMIEVDEAQELGLTKGTIKTIDNYIFKHKKRLEETQILFVGLGMPKQEYFIEYLNKDRNMNHGMIAVGVGGSFDEIAGVVPHCPDWISSIGMKWLFRLVTEPRRWKRQLSLFEFMWLLVTKK